VAIAAMPSPRPVSPSPSVVVAETETELWAVADDLDSDVADDKASIAHNLRRPGQQHDTRGARQLGAVSAEVRAQVSDAGGREQRVAGGVGGNIAI